MKTAGTENPNLRAIVPRSRVHGAEGQNRSCSIRWAAKQKKLRPVDWCFSLTSSFIEPTTRCAESVAPGSATRVVSGEQKTQGLETALPNPRDRPDPGGGVAGHPADPAPLPHQTAAVDLQRFRH